MTVDLQSLRTWGRTMRAINDCQVFQLIQSGRPASEVLAAVAEATTAQLQAGANQLCADDNAYYQAEKRISLWARATGVQAIFRLGGFLCIISAMTDNERHCKRFPQILNALDVSKTKAYDAMAIFRAYPIFLREPKLAGKFCIESLKRLAAKSAADAREAALEVARRGEEVSIKRAMALIKECAVDTDTGANATRPTGGGAAPTREPRPGPWKFDGDLMQLTVKTKKEAEAFDPSRIARELAAALKKFCRDHGIAELGDEPSDSARGKHLAEE